MTGPGGIVSAMQLGVSGDGTQGPGRHSWTVPYLGQRQAALPRGPRAPQGGRSGSQPRRCRQRQQWEAHFLHLELGAHPLVQKQRTSDRNPKSLEVMWGLTSGCLWLVTARK